MKVSDRRLAEVLSAGRRGQRLPTSDRDFDAEMDDEAERSAERRLQGAPRRQWKTTSVLDRHDDLDAEMDAVAERSVELQPSPTDLHRPSPVQPPESDPGSPASPTHMQYRTGRHGDMMCAAEAAMPGRRAKPNEVCRHAAFTAILLGLFVVGARIAIDDQQPISSDASILASPWRTQQLASPSPLGTMTTPPTSPPIHIHMPSPPSAPPPPSPWHPPDVPVGSPETPPPSPELPPPRAPPPTPAAPPPVTLHWEEHPGRRCWHDGHGGKALGGFLQGAPGLHLARAEQCRASCASDQPIASSRDFACVGVVWDTHHLVCYKYREIILELCSTDDQYTVFLRVDGRVPPPPAHPPSLPPHAMSNHSRLSYGSYAAELNARYNLGEISNDLFNAGILIHQFDFMDDGDPRGTPWVPGKV